MVATRPAPGRRSAGGAVTVLLAALLVLVAVLVWPGRHPADLQVPQWQASRRESAVQLSSPGNGHPATGARAPSGALVRRGRGGHHELEAILGVLDALVPALRAGLAPASALGCLDLWGARSARVSVLLNDLLDAAEQGEPLAPVWLRHARDVGSAEVALIGRAWALSESLGAPLADCVGMAADLVRQRMARERRLSVALAGPRATTTVLTLLPLAGPGVALLMGIGPGELYSGVPALASVALGLLFLGAGRWWCARMVRGLARPRAAREGSW